MRVGLLGGECTGKTTLALALAGALDAPCTSEALRDFVTEHDRVPRREEQLAILMEQRRREDALGGPVVICDPATAMTAIYSQWYYGDRTLMPLAIEQARDYDLILWCRPDIPWVADPGMHDGPQARDGVDECIAEFVTILVADHGIRVHQMRGSVSDRLRDALEVIRTASG